MWLHEGRHTGSCVVSTFCRERTRAQREGTGRHMGENKEGSEQL